MAFVFDETLGFYVNRCGILMREELQRRFRMDGFDVTTEEWALLGALKAQGNLPVSALAKATLKDRTTVTRFVDRLVEKGLVERRKEKSDLRVVSLALTKQGEKTTLRLIEIVKIFLGEVQSQVPKEKLAITKSVLAQICESLKADDQSPANQS